MGQKLTLTETDGFEFQAYLAEPEAKTKGGVVICQEIFGVNDYLKSACDFYAAKVATLPRQRLRANARSNFSPGMSVSPDAKVVQSCWT